jgi:hypothetical protein
LLGFALALTALFAWEVATTPPFVVDDAYITFSFSKNLARGAGPTYGHDLRVEGYSNFLWMVLVALPIRIAAHTDPIVLARVMMVPFVALLFSAAFALARARAGFALSLFAPLLLALNVDVILAYDSGLETVPYVALLTAGFAAYVWGEASRTARRLVIPAFTAAALMRIDGFVALGFIVVVDAARAWSGRTFSLRGFARWALPGLLVWALWFAWRWRYYGLPLPSTYYAKALIPELLPRRGAEYVLDETLGSGLWVGLPAFGFLLWRRLWPAVPVGLFAVGQLVYAAKVGGDWMPSARFVLPATPLLVVLSIWAARDVLERARVRGASVLALTGAAALAVFAFVVQRVEPHLTSVPVMHSKVLLAVDQTEHVRRLKRAARYLALLVPPGGRLVTDYGGVIAYYTEANPIEMWGLCNATIATRGGIEKVNPIYGRTCPACYPSLDPEYFHVAEPMVRREDSFRSHDAVVRAVWQADTIGRYLDLFHGFTSGRIVNERTGEAVWFLERKRSDWTARPRSAEKGVFIEYPFEPGGIAAR